MSHSVGGGPFRPNKERGVWSNPHDFALACLNNAFRIDNMYGIAIVPMIVSNGFLPVLWWFFDALLYAVPIFFVQSFLGQFSSSGYISALRISPLFKCLGYIGLAINIVSLALHGVLIAIPVMYFIHSLQPTLPWSCDAPHPWTPVELNPEGIFSLASHCSFNYSTETDIDFVLLSVPSVEFFEYKLRDFSFEVVGYLVVAWAAVAFAVYHRSEKIGLFIRYSTIIVVSLLVIVLLRMLFLPGVLENMGVAKLFHPGTAPILQITMPIFMTFMTFGPGWGSVLSLASYNKFKTDIVKSSWQIPLCQLVLLLLLGTLADFAEVHLTRDYQHLIPSSQFLDWMNLVAIPSTLSSIGFPHFWTWMFLIMIILGSFNLMLTQLFSIQTALLDEFEYLRPFNKLLPIVCASVLALLSAPFCKLERLEIIAPVLNMSVLSQCFLNLILLLVVLLSYGHKRLKRDVEFMTNQVLANWKLFFLRFAAPSLLGFTLVGFVFGDYRLMFGEIGVISSCMLLLPWVALPIYCVYRLSRVRGGFRLRLSRCTAPSDWYPVDADDKQRYDERFEDQEDFSGLTTVML